MAFPTMLFNSSTGSDTLASGAGPGTAITGTTGRTRNAAGELRFGLFGATDDLSGLSAISGTDVIFMNIATAGQRNFSTMAASGIKNTRQTGTDAAITSGTAALTVGSTAGWTLGDVIKVTGAGAAGGDLYTTLASSLTPTSVTLTDNAGTTVGPAAAWENPKQVVLRSGEGVNTGTTDTAWAIGGKRLTLFGTNSLKLFTNNSAAGDAMEGWILEMESGYTETRASVVDIRRVQTVTTGGMTLRGAAAAATLPILTFSNNGVALQMRGTGWTLQDFEIRNTNATKTASLAIQGASGGNLTTINRVVVSHSTDKFWKAFGHNAASGWYIRDCNVGFCANVGIDMGSGGAAHKIVGCWIHDCGSHGISSQSVSIIQGVFAYNLIETNAGDGCLFTDTGASAVGGGYSFIGNTIAYNTGDGIEFTLNVGTTERPLVQSIFLNNIFSNNGGWGLNLSGTGWSDATFAAEQIDVNYNDFSTNTSGALGGTGSALTLPSTNQTVDPQFVDAANSNFAVGLNVAGLGFPGARNVGANLSATLSALDIGVSQRQPPGGSGYLLVAP